MCRNTVVRTLYHRESLFKAAVCVYLLGNLALGQTSNILTNGGFENGLMCYTTSIWNQANDSFASDYKFLSSTDAHSGSSSLEIRCLTANCLKAAILSSQIPTPPAQAYKLSLYTKCPAGRSADVYIPNTLGGSTGQRLTCNGGWAPNTVNFTTSATAASFFFYVYNRDLEWLRIDDMVLTYADGTVPQRPILHPGRRNVSISGQRVNVDGKPYLALGFFDVPYNDLGQVASLGANVVAGLGYQAPANCFNTAQPSYLDRAYDLGLNFVPDSTTTARLAAPGLFPTVATQYGPHLANIAWMLGDEPDQSNVPAFYIPPASFIASYQALAPAVRLPLVADYQRAAWSVASDIAPYNGSSDIWMAEPYGGDFYYPAHAVSNFNSIAVKPIWFAQDGSDVASIVPKAYYNLTLGVTGIFYFVWDDFKNSPAQLSGASQVFRELNQLTPALFAPTLAVTPPAGISAIGRTLDGAHYIIAANPATATVRGNFAVAGLVANTGVEVMFENRTLTSTQGGFEDSFAGISRHVYRISAAVKQTPRLTWAQPASIRSGTALSATQLNATSNVAGTFVYTPAVGAILPAGSQQLAVTFTPRDAALYTTASATVTLTVLPRPAQLTLTRTITRDAAARMLIITATISNTGGTTAMNVRLLAGSINGVAGTPLPLALGNIQPNASVTATLRVAASAGRVNTSGLVALGGTYDGGSFANVTRALLP